MILDLGCGTQKHGDVGVDIRRLKNVDVIADAHHLPFRNEVFSECNALAVLEHVDNPLQVLKEINHVLKKGGHIKIILPRDSRMPMFYVKLILLLRWRKVLRVYKTMREGTHKWQFSIAGLHKLFKLSNFNPLNIEYVPTPLLGNITSPKLISRKVAKFLMMLRLFTHDNITAKTKKVNP